MKVFPIQLTLLSLFLVFSLFLTALSGQSEYQKTVIPGAKWTIRKGQGMGSFGYSEITITCDSLRANEKKYLRVELLSDVNGASCALGYVREDTIEQRLYFIPEDDENQEEVLIVDYALEKGDTFVNDRGIEFIVDTVRQIDFFGQSTKFIDFGPMASDGFIVGFGSYMAGPVLNCEGFTNIEGYELLDLDCQPVTSLREEPLEQLIAISPNPANLQLRVDLTGQVNEPVSLRIISIHGLLLLETRVVPGSNPINLHPLPKGMLLLKFTQGNERLIKKIIHY
jgi:hypothetical protein